MKTIILRMNFKVVAHSILLFYNLLFNLFFVKVTREGSID